MIEYGNGERAYEGAVVRLDEKHWMDGMISEYAIAWDMDEHEFKTIEVGYYGCDGRNLMGKCATVDVSTEVARDILRTMKSRAVNAYCKEVQSEKDAIKAGREAVIVRGRKYPKGTRVSVFWVGERETYMSRQYSWMHETEKVAGCHDEDGNKIWIKAEYLKNITKVDTPSAADRRRFIRDYVRRAAGDLVMRTAESREAA